MNWEHIPVFVLGILQEQDFITEFSFWMGKRDGDRWVEEYRLLKGKKRKGIFQLQRCKHKLLTLLRVKAAKYKITPNAKTYGSGFKALHSRSKAGPLSSHLGGSVTIPSDTQDLQLSSFQFSPLNNRSQKVGTTYIFASQKDHTGGSWKRQQFTIRHKRK